ncbi:hypothetical protein T439DRAFT_355504 [Meredithblackwellia eburnea MCA 4105]
MRGEEGVYVAADWRQQPIVPASLFIFAIPYRLGSLFLRLIQTTLFVIALTLWDYCYFFPNLILPFAKPGHAVPPPFSPVHPPKFSSFPFAWTLCMLARFLGKASPEWLVHWSYWSGVGYQGNWGPASAPAATDSRSPCPALNVLANHGAIPRNGRHISPHQLAAAAYRAFNLSPTLAIQLLSAHAPFFEERGWFDLEDIGGQGVIQHDGSFLREDSNSPWAHATVIATQRTPSVRLIDMYFPPNSLEPVYTWKNFSRILAHRRQWSREHVGTFTLNLLQYIFSSGNAALIHEIVGGEVSVIRPWVGSGGHEAIPAGFEPKCRQYWGMSILQLQIWTAIIEFGCGALEGKRMVNFKDNVQANDGWNANLGVPGTDKLGQRLSLNGKVLK